MGTKPQYRPTQLAKKLLKIRCAFRLSQTEMLEHLSVDQSLTPAGISEYESGTRVPSLLILMAYGRAARLPLEILIDDEAVLPKSLPGNFDYHTHKQLPTHPMEFLASILQKLTPS
jgi:transcriptional regulator with XRE-family HTH domain